MFLVARDRAPVQEQQAAGPIEVEEARVGVLDEVGPVPVAGNETG